MLTATYTLVALSVEQTSVRTSLQALQKLVRSTFREQTTLSQMQVDVTRDTIKGLYDSCHWRKLDKFLIPAVRRAGDGADRLLDELDALSQAAADAMAAALRSDDISSQDQVAQFCGAIELFCAALLERLEREERELFPIAGSVISGEDWFGIANQMLAHDAYQQESRRGDSMPRGGVLPRPIHGQRPPSYAH